MGRDWFLYANAGGDSIYIVLYNHLTSLRHMHSAFNALTMPT